MGLSTTYPMLLLACVLYTSSATIRCVTAYCRSPYGVPYCSCKLTKGYGVPYCSCKPTN